MDDFLVERKFQMILSIAAFRVGLDSLSDIAINFAFIVSMRHSIGSMISDCTQN